MGPEGGPGLGAYRMAMTQLERNGLPPVSDEIAEAVDGIVDMAFWQVMLNDELEACERDVRFLQAAIELRWQKVRRDLLARTEVELESPWRISAAIFRASNPAVEHLKNLGWVVVRKRLLDVDEG